MGVCALNGHGWGEFLVPGNVSIELAERRDADAVVRLLSDCRDQLLGQGIHQWDEEYPSIDYVVSDVAQGSLRKLVLSGRIVAVISFDEIQEPEYSTVRWRFTEPPILVIHRLAVSPSFQGRGYARMLVDHVEQSARDLQFNSIRIDTYSGNTRVLDFYQRRGYERAGEVYFPRRELPFVCMERAVTI